MFISNFIPASWAIAGRCKTVLDDPPKAKSTVTAFSNDLREMIFEVVKFSSTIFTILSPDLTAILSFSESTAGVVPHLGREIPRASERHAIVLAVNIPAQEPQVGQAASSKPARSSSSRFPDFTPPTASNTVI